MNRIAPDHLPREAVVYSFWDEKGKSEYHGDWAFSRADERRAFENFVDFVMARWEKFSGLHIYHYAPYEPATLKRLMGRYATREEEIDRMLRAACLSISIRSSGMACAPVSRAIRSSGWSGSTPSRAGRRSPMRMLR